MIKTIKILGICHSVTICCKICEYGKSGKTKFVKKFTLPWRKIILCYLFWEMKTETFWQLDCFCFCFGGIEGNNTYGKRAADSKTVILWEWTRGRGSWLLSETTDPGRTTQKMCQHERWRTIMTTLTGTRGIIEDSSWQIKQKNT